MTPGLIVQVEFEARCASCGMEFPGTPEKPATVWMTLDRSNPRRLRFWCRPCIPAGEEVSLDGA